MHPIDFYAILTRVAGLGILATDTAFQQTITTLFGEHGTTVIAGIGFISILATDVLRVLANPTQTPTQKIEAALAAPAFTLPKDETK